MWYIKITELREGQFSMLKQYEIYLRSEKKSEKTISAYVRWNKKFLKESGKPEEEITYLDLINWLNQFSGKSSATVYNIIASLKNYFSFLEKVHYISYNPARDLKQVTVNSKEKIALSGEQVRAIINNIRTDRDRAMIILMCSTGLRFSETISIRKTDIVRGRQIIILGKGNKERIIYLNDETQKAISDYLRYAPKEVKENEYLFVSYEGHELQNNSFNRAIKRAAKKAGIPNWEDISAHWMRHAAANFWCDAGVPVRDISKALGHSNISTTTRYLHVSQEKINQMMNNTYF